MTDIYESKDIDMDEYGSKINWNLLANMINGKVTEEKQYNLQYKSKGRKRIFTPEEYKERQKLAAKKIMNEKYKNNPEFREKQLEYKKRKYAEKKALLRNINDRNQERPERGNCVCCTLEKRERVGDL